MLLYSEIWSAGKTKDYKESVAKHKFNQQSLDLPTFQEGNNDSFSSAIDPLQTMASYCIYSDKENDASPRSHLPALASTNKRLRRPLQELSGSDIVSRDKFYDFTVGRSHLL